MPESPAIGSLDETYNLLPQPWGGWDQGVKTDEVPCTNVNQRACRPEEMMIEINQGPGEEKICDRFAFLAFENYVDQPPVVFGVSERDAGARTEVVKTKHQ